MKIHFFSEKIVCDKMTCYFLAFFFFLLGIEFVYHSRPELTLFKLWGGVCVCVGGLQEASNSCVKHSQLKKQNKKTYKLKVRLARFTKSSSE